jgi:hypothetical protein
VSAGGLSISCRAEQGKACRAGRCCLDAPQLALQIVDPLKMADWTKQEFHRCDLSERPDFSGSYAAQTS